MLLDDSLMDAGLGGPPVDRITFDSSLVDLLLLR